MAMSGRQRSEQRCHILALCWLLVLPFSAAALSLEMKYKPPVQSSVSKLRNSRFSSTNEKHSRTSNRAAASSVATPQDLSNTSPSFEDRMRGLVFGKQNTQPMRKLPPNVCTVENLQEYKNVVGEETSKVVAVRFFADWCKACKAAQPLFYRTAKQFPNVVWAILEKKKKGVKELISFQPGIWLSVQDLILEINQEILKKPVIEKAIEKELPVSTTLQAATAINEGFH